MTDWKNSRQALQRGAGSLLGIIIGVIIARYSPPSGLTVQAMSGLGIFACAVIWWVVDVLPDYVTGILMCTAWVVFEVVPFSKAFAAFSGDTVWLLVGALGIGLAVTKSGLLNRTSLFLMSKFPPTFKGQTLALLFAGNVIAPLIPSTTAKVAIVAPFAQAISDHLGFARKSRGAGGLFAAMYMGFGATGPVFLSASFIGYTLKGSLPLAYQAQITWMNWFLAACAYGIILFIGSYFAIQYLYRPEKDSNMERGYIRTELAKLGPITRNEKVVMCVLVVSLLMWMTEKTHGIAAALVALVALCILLAFDIFDRNDFKSGIGWDSVVFIGSIIGLATVLPALQIDKWIATMLGPTITPLLSNIYLFVIAGAMMTYLLRFVIVSMTAVVSIFTVLLAPFAINAGISPWVTGFIVYAAAQVFNISYQNSTYLAGFYATGGEMVSHRQMARMSIAYMIICCVGLLACVPIWRIMHLIP
ncbi:2-oxoglutarate/malate translocator [hydrocarbon metagenome]|uniref:2-oxoglutarate/malate translocator n=1 Tax=hydrocarbon metagenome TaxID=938273 RepID=A0A0W8E461_9ZZZZ